MRNGKLNSSTEVETPLYVSNILYIIQITSSAVVDLAGVGGHAHL